MAKRRTIKTSVKVSVKRKLLERDGALCCICGLWLLIDGKKPRLENLKTSIEHRVPVSMGGSDDLENLALAHCFCNQMRGPEPLTDELRRRARRLLITMAYKAGRVDINGVQFGDRKYL